MKQRNKVHPHTSFSRSMLPFSLFVWALPMTVSEQELPLGFHPCSVLLPPPSTALPRLEFFNLLSAFCSGFVLRGAVLAQHTTLLLFHSRLGRDQAMVELLAFMLLYNIFNLRLVLSILFFYNVFNLVLKWQTETVNEWYQPLLTLFGHFFARAIPTGLTFGLCLGVLRSCNVHVLYYIQLVLDLNFIVKSPEVTLRGWLGYKPSRNT